MWMSVKPNWLQWCRKVKNIVGPVVISGDNLPSPVLIGLTDVQNMGGGGSGPPGPHGSGITAFDVLHFLIAISDIDLNWIRILKVPGEFNDSQFINAYLKKKTLGLKLPSYVIHTRTSIYCLKTFPDDFSLNRSYQKTFKEQSYIKKKVTYATYIPPVFSDRGCPENK